MQKVLTSTYCLGGFMFATFLFLFNAVVAYLVGSISSAVIVCRLCDLPDPRLEGSKNPGATNVLRLAGKQYAAIVLLADMLKGLLPVLLAQLLGAGPVIVGFTCFAAVLGHMFPIFFDFKGGKGVATAIGALLGFHFLLGVMVIVTWLLIANFTRYSSLASIVSIILAPFYSLFVVHSIIAFPPLMCIAIFVLYQHRENITRLIDGKESKINFHHKAHHTETINEPKPKPAKAKLKPAKTTKLAVKTTKSVKATTLKPVKTTSKAAPKKKPAAAKKVTPKKKV